MTLCDPWRANGPASSGLGPRNLFQQSDHFSYPLSHLLEQLTACQDVFNLHHLLYLADLSGKRHV